MKTSNPLKTARRSLALATMALGAALGAMATPAQSAPKIQWETSLATAKQKAKATKRPILVDFYGVGCTVCKQMELTTYANASVVGEAQKWVMVKLDVLKNEAVAKHYRAESFPTVVFLKPGGQLVNGFKGYVSASELIKQMRAAAPKARK
jgi:thiol:disulfide interchange protein